MDPFGGVNIESATVMFEDVSDRLITRSLCLLICEPGDGFQLSLPLRLSFKMPWGNVSPTGRWRNGAFLLPPRP